MLPASQGDQDHVIVPAQIAIEGAAIASVQRAHAPVAEPIVDFGDALVTPAFVNPHTHLSMACFRGLAVDAATQGNVIEDLFYAVESHLTDDDVRAFARLGCYESLLHGVGFVWEHYYEGAALAQALCDTGLAGCIAPTVQDVSGPGTAQLERQVDATLAIHRDQALRDRGIVAALGPHATDTVSVALWERVRDIAHREGLPVHAHVAQSIEEFERAHASHGVSCVGVLERAGMLSEDVERFLMVHAIFMTHEDLDVLDPRRHALCFCPYSQLIFNFPAHVPSWEERGLPWVVATDAAASNDSMNVQKEMRFVAGLRDAALSSSPEYASFLRSGELEGARAVRDARARLFAERRHWAHESFLLDRVWG
ncbi:MAG: amidohydrolase family protein, partial [Myxococcota bacterium]